MDTQDNFVTLYNGHKMPKFGLGTFAMTDGKAIKQSIVDYGYRMFDCASFYKNEELVGSVLNEVLNVDKTHTREEMFVISKVWWDEVEDVEAACRRSLKKLQVDYLDLYLVHWPIAVREVKSADEEGGPQYEKIKIPMHKIWAQMEALVDKGLVRSIGISNFNLQLTWDLLNYARIRPACNEVELHPLNVQDNLVKFMKAENIVPIGYCPIARGADTRKCPDLSESPTVKALMEKHGKTGAQVLLNWGLQRGHIMIPKSNNPVRIKENIDAMTFTLSQEDIDSLTAMDEGHRICNNYPWMLGTSIFV